MRRTARYAFAAFAWLFFVGVVVQVFFAGVGLFGAGSMETHVSLGWTLHLVPLVILLLAWGAGAGRRTMWHAAALFLVTFVQPILAIMRADQPWVAALHPVVALGIFWLALEVARMSLTVVRADAPARPVRAAAQEA